MAIILFICMCFSSEVFPMWMWILVVLCMFKF